MTDSKLSKEERAANEEAARLIESRKKAIKLMPDNLRKVLQFLEADDARLRSDNIRHYYRRGEQCARVRDNPQDYIGEDGTTPGLELLEAALSARRETIRRYIKFFSDVTPENMEKLIEISNKEATFSLHWGHINVLLTAPPTDHLGLAEECVKNLWSPDLLHAVIKERYPRPGDGHGPKPRIPEEIDKQLQQVLQVTNKWLRRYSTCWLGEDSNVCENVMELRPEKISGKLVDDLEALCEAMSEVAVAAESANVKFISALEHVRKQLAEREDAKPRRRGRAVAGNA